MKRFAAMVFAILFTLVPAVQADQHVATIKNVSNQAQVSRDGSIIGVKIGEKLMNADVITTESDGSVGIVFIDGTAITVGPDSVFRIDHYVFEPNVETYDFSVYLKKGSALFDSGKISRLSPDSVRLATPRATVGIRGTRFIVEVK